MQSCDLICNGQRMIAGKDFRSMDPITYPYTRHGNILCHFQIIGSITDHDRMFSLDTSLGQNFFQH